MRKVARTLFATLVRNQHWAVTREPAGGADMSGWWVKPVVAAVWELDLTCSDQVPVRDIVRIRATRETGENLLIAGVAAEKDPLASSC